MKSDNIVAEKSYSFALDIIKISMELMKEKKEFVLSKQLLKSGTSVGANIEEAIGGQSQRDFFAKMTISYKEARETKYWLRLLRDSGILEDAKAQVMLDYNEELLRIIGSIQRTTKNKLNRP